MPGLHRHLPPLSASLSNALAENPHAVLENHSGVSEVIFLVGPHRPTHSALGPHLRDSLLSIPPTHLCPSEAPPVSTLTHSLWEINRPAAAPDQAAILCHPGTGSRLLYSPLHSGARSCHSRDSHFTKNKVCPDLTTCESLSPHLPLPSHTGLCSSDTPYWACFDTCIYAFTLHIPAGLHLLSPSSGMIFPGYLWGLLIPFRFHSNVFFQQGLL